MYTRLVLALFIILSFSVKKQGTAQNITNPQDKVQEVTNQDRLTQLAENWNNEWQRKHARALRLARQNNWLIREVEPDGTVIELQYLGHDSMPVYYMTTNEDAAATISTDDVWPGGSLGLNLTGSGMTVGEWDGGKILTTHQEFTGRVTQEDFTNDTSDHATHVAGTLVGKGVEPGARGMANKATLKGYTFGNDEAEMSNEASGGLLLSNHSYARVAGFRKQSGEWRWYGDPDISEQEDYAFGFYTQFGAKRWDEIAYNAPFYLIVKAAGNDRNDNLPNGVDTHYIRNDQFDWVPSTVQRDPDGDYDCINPKGVAKNVLTVGAVQDITGGYQNPGDVDMTNFSNWGPTDDGRIKPDLVGNGTGLYSASSNHDSAYSRKRGTSMAAPNVTGSLLLLQSLFQKIHGTPMRAATLKSVAIHTADEAGDAPGPDYEFGWGLMNTTKAAELILSDTTRNNIQELTLENNNTNTYKVQADGNEPLVATICWTDPPGNPPNIQLDPDTKMLINDLDLRIIDSSQTAHFPWKMDPANPSAAAGRGDNSRDNIEQVLIQNPTPGGIYTVKISHEGTLQGNQGNFQNYSLIISGIQAQNQAAACQDTTRINSNYGFISDGSGEDLYGNNTNCYWELTSQNGKPFHLNFINFQTSKPGDTLFVYEGHDKSNLIKTYTGNEIPDDLHASSDKIMLHFKTDGNFTNEGWEIQYASYDLNACWGGHKINYHETGNAHSTYNLPINSNFSSGSNKLTEAGEAFTDFVDRNGDTFSQSFPIRIDSFSLGITHQNNSGVADTFEVYIQPLDSPAFPSGKTIWEEQKITHQSLSPTPDSIQFIRFKPKTVVDGPFFIGVRYNGPIEDSASIVGYFENVGSASNPEATEAKLGKSFRKYPAFNNNWQPTQNGTENKYYDRNNNNQYDRGTNEAHFMQILAINPSVSRTYELPSSDPQIQRVGQNLTVQGDYENYQWYRNDSLLAGKTGSEISLSINGKYKVKAYQEHASCGKFSNVINYQAPRINKPVAVYPNPSSGVFQLRLQQPETIKSIDIISIDGRNVLSQSNVIRNQYTINLEQEPEGVYLMEVNMDDGVERFRLVVQ